MSLLNQVLQDLDGRVGSEKRPELRLASEGAAAAQGDDREARLGVDWTVVARASGLILLALVAGVLTATVLSHVDESTPAVAVAPLELPEVAEPVADDLPPPAPVSPPDAVDPSGVSAAPPRRRVEQQAALDPRVVPVAETNAGLPATREKGPLQSPPPVARVAEGVPSLADVSAPLLPLRNVALPGEPAPTAASASDPGRVASQRVKPAMVKAAAPVSPLAEVRRMIREGDLARAEVRLGRYLKERPGSREGRELLLGLMLRGDRRQAAMDQLDIGLARHPAHTPFLLIKARLLHEQGSTDAALTVLEAHRHGGRATPEMLKMLGALYQQQGGYSAAAEVYRELTGLRQNDGPAWAGLAISLDAAGDAGAREAYARALRVGGLPQAAADYAAQRLAELGEGGG